MAKKKIEIDVVVDDKGTTKKVALSQKQLEDALDRSGEATGRATKQQRGLIQTANSGGKNFANLASSITNGIVPAYAVLAAQVFAVTAAFQFLQEAANVRNLIVAQEEYGAITGVAYSRITKALQEATAGQLRFQEAAQATAIGTAAGLTGDQLVKLSEAAKNTSFALGRDLTDSFNRLIRGVTKAEPELLDELGIVLRLEPAVAAYAASIGKSANQLNSFERTQAVANFTLEEAERKFGGIGKVIDDEALAVQKFMKAFDDLSNTIKIALVNVLNPILSFLSQNVLALTGLLSIFAAPLVKSVIPSFEDFGKASKKASREAIKGLRAARGEVEKQKEAAENLVLSQEKAFNKASQLAEKGNIGKLGEGKKGGRGAVDFLSGASDSKSAQRNAKRVLEAARKEFDKDGRIRRGKLKGFNEQELKDLEKSYKMRVKASSLATKQISTRWGILRSKQRVLAAQTSLAWRNAFIKIGKAGAKAPEFIDKAFRGASFIGLALLLVDIGRSVVDALFPASKAAQELEEKLAAGNERLAELEGHLARVEKKNFEGVLTLNETVAQIGAAITEANIPKFIEEINLLATAEDKSSEKFKEFEASALASAKSIVALDRNFAPLLQALKEGRVLTDAEQESLRGLATEAQNGGMALATMAQAQKDANLEAARVVQGIPKAPLENLIATYKTLTEAGKEASVAQQNVYDEEQARIADRLAKVNDRLSLSTEQQKKDALDVNSANYNLLPLTRQLLEEKAELEELSQAELKALQEVQAVQTRNLAIQESLERAAGEQLNLQQLILDNNLELAKINQTRQDFASRLNRLQATTLQSENKILTAVQNEISAEESLSIAKRQAGKERTQAVINAERQLEQARQQVELAIEQGNRGEEVNQVKREEIALEKELLVLQRRRNDIDIRKRRRDIFLEFQTKGAGSLGRAGGDIQRDIRGGALATREDAVDTSIVALEEARNNLAKARIGQGELTLEQARRQLELAKAQVASAKSLLLTEQNRINLLIDSVRLETERVQRKTSLIMLSPIERELEDFLLKNNLERKDLSADQLALLKEQITVQQSAKIVAAGLVNIQQSFTRSLESGIEGLLSGTITLKSAFLDLAKSVVASLNQMIAKMIAFQIASAVFSSFAPSGSGTSAPVAQNMTQAEINAQLASGGSVITRYGGFTEPRGYREGGIARGRHAGYGAILHGTEAVIPLAQGAKSIPVEFTGKGSAGGTNNVTVNVAMDSSGNTQTQTSTDTAESNAAFGKAIAAAVQREIHNQKRPGGMLSPYGAGAA